MSSLPSGGTTNFFGDLAKSIYSNHERNCAEVVDEVHRALVEESPYFSGTLSSNWEKGIRPRSKVKNKVVNEKGISGPWIRNVYPRASVSPAKTYGIHYKYYIWNNTHYLEHVNEGTNPLVNNAKAYVGFVKKAINIGVARASGKI